MNVAFNNVSVISWRSVLLVKESGGPGENHRPDTDKLYHIIWYLAWAGFELTTLVVIGSDYTDCIGSYKSNYHTITTTANVHLVFQYTFYGILQNFVSFLDNIKIQVCLVFFTI